MREEFHPAASDSTYDGHTAIDVSSRRIHFCVVTQRPSDPPRMFVELPSGPAAYTDEGEGPPLVLVHGLPGSVRDYRWLAPQLSPFARVLRVDLPGFGETPVATEPDASPLGRARFVLAWLKSLGVGRATLVGHSMGGVVSCAAASLEPERFEGLVLLASPGVRPHATLRRVPFPVIERLMAKPRVWEGLRPLTRQLFKWGGFKGYSDAALDRTLLCVARTSIAAHAARVRSLALPTAVAWAQDDPLIEAEIMTELADACPSGPRLPFETGGHNIQKSQAAPIAQAIRSMVSAG